MKTRAERRIVADDHGATLTVSLVVGGITASTESRTLSGVVVKYGRYGNTSKGKLRVAPGALQFPEDLGRVKLTREHVREDTRGHLAKLEYIEDGIRASFKVSDGQPGDDALREAQDRTRDGLSFDVVDAVVDGDTITSARVIAIGQVGIPAYYDDGRIDSIAASHNPGDPMTKEERARLAELRAKNSRNETEEKEFQTLAAKALDEASKAPDDKPADKVDDKPADKVADQQPADQQPADQVAASMPSVPAGVPASNTKATPVAGAALTSFCENLADSLNKATDKNGKQAAITAAFQDITQTAHASTIGQPAWSGELWSGLQYEPQWIDLFNSGTLDRRSGIGWRFTSKLEMQDYAGDKTAVPSDNVTTETSSYSAARMAVGVDIDREFFDFEEVNAAFIRALVEQIRESWTMQLDLKVRAFTLANAETAKVVESAGTGSTVLDPQVTLLKAAAAAVRSLKRRKVGKASFVYVNDDDLFTLMDVAEKDVSAFLELFGIDPKNFRSDEGVPAGTVLAGVKPTATVRTRAGFPVIIDAQNLVNGGVDKAAFGYWAIEEHHTRGLTSVAFNPDFVPA